MRPTRACRKAICRFGVIWRCRLSRGPARFWVAFSSDTRSPRVFTDRAERIVSGLAAQAAVAIDNARLYQANQQEIESRRKAEQELQRSNQTLEQRVEQRARELAASQTKLEDTERRFRLLGRERYRLRDLHAGFTRQYSQLERGSGTDQGVRARRDHQPSLFEVLYRRGAGKGDSRKGVGDRGNVREIRSGRLARTQGRHQLLGGRRHQRDQVAEGRTPGICQDNPRPDGATRRR